MRWHPAILVLLLICALSKWLLATDIQIQDPSLAGMPLSDAEYDHFFKTLNSPRRVSAVCFLRSMYGCQNALVQTLDLYENHGIVPEGRVCSDLAEMPSFPDFCTLTFYRCTLKKYFVKRIQCPDEISETLQNTNQELENIESSSTLQEMPLTNHFPITLPTMTSPPPLISVSNTPTATSEIILTISDTTTGTVKLPSIISDITATRPLLDLPTSSTPVTTDSESLLELLTSLDAVIAEQSFPELFTTTLNTAEGSLSQHLMSDVFLPTPVPKLSSTSNAMAATPVISLSVATESSSKPTSTPSLGFISTNPATTVAPASSPTSASTSPIVTLTATETITPSVGSVPTNPATTVAAASSPTSASTSPIVTLTATETITPSVGSVSTNPATTIAPASSPTSASTSPIVTVTATEITTPSVGSVPTNPATTIALTSSPTSPSTSPVVTVSATETITPSVGSFPTNPATSVAPASSPTSASSPIVTVTATEITTPSMGSVPTNPATTIAPASSPTSASPSPIVTVTATSTPSSSPSASSSTPSKTSVLLTKPTIPKSPAHVLSPVRVAEWPVVPISAVLGQYPLQPTSVMQLVLLPPGFGPRKSKPQAIAISSLLPFGAGPSNIWPKKIMLKPPKKLPTTAKRDKFSPTKSSTAAELENSLPTKSSIAARLQNSLPTNPPTSAKWENFLSRLQDNRVQQLMQKMRELMGKGKAVKKQLLQSTSLQLLSALKNVKQKSLASLASKKQLQR